MATADEDQQLREMTALQTAQLDAVTQELTAQRAATAQTEVRAGLSLLDTKLLTKPNVYSGEKFEISNNARNSCEKQKT